MERERLISRRRKVVFLVYILAFLQGFDCVFDPGRPVDALFALLFPIFMTYLCIVDSQIRGAPLIRSFHWLIFFTWPVSVPIYLIRAQGWKRLHWAVLSIGGFFLAALLGYFLAGSLVPDS